MKNKNGTASCDLWSQMNNVMLEGFWIRNYKSLRQVGIGIGFPQFNFINDETNVFPYQLDGTVLFTGASGTGKSSVVDAFSFVSDCYRHGVDAAFLKRGGYDAVYTHGGKGSISFGFHYRQPDEADTVTYALSIEQARNGAPYIDSELLAYRRGKESVPVFFLQNGVKSIRYLAPDPGIGSAELTRIEFTDYRHLGLAALESHPRFPVVASLRNLFENWVLSHFTPDPARGLDSSLPRRQESPRGVSLSGVVRYMVGRYGSDCDVFLQRICPFLPNVESIHLDRTDAERPRLAFSMTGAEKPISITLLSDATIRLFTYALLLEEDDPAPLLVLEEPENGLDRLHCWKLTELIRHTVDASRDRQLFVTTHHPGIADVLHPSQVWVFEKNREGHTVVERAADSLVLQDAVEEDRPIEPRWFSDRFEDKL